MSTPTVSRARAREASGAGFEAAPAVELTGVAKRYAGTVAVHPLDLTLRRGEAVALLGPNGAGKSTTIGMMLGIVHPDAGTARVAGRSAARAVADGSIAGMLQDAGPMPGVRVAELVRLCERSYPNALSTSHALELAGLADEAKRRVDRLSGGQAQRLRFAMAIVANPEVLLLDEPTRALDVQGRAEFWTAMRDFARSGKTVVFATHYLDEVAENAQRVIVIAGGRVIADGTPEEIRGTAGTSVVRFRFDETAGAAESVDRLASLPGVRSVEHGLGDRGVAGRSAAGRSAAGRRAVRATITCADADSVVRALVTAVPGWHDLQVAPPDLNSTFLELTRSTAGIHSRQNPGIHSRQNPDTQRDGVQPERSRS
ncbi:ABC transporter ATP-binding protein [Humibacter antri]